MRDLTTIRVELGRSIDKLDSSMKRGFVQFDEWSQVRATIGAIYSVLIGMSSELIKTLQGENQILFLDMLSIAEDFISAVNEELGQEV